MNSKRLFAAGFAALVGVAAAVATADAASKHTYFKGTRDQVRAACSAVGGDLIEESNSSTCLNGNNNTAVSCSDDGQCMGSTPGLTTSSQTIQSVLRGTAGVAAMTR